MNAAGLPTDLYISVDIAIDIKGDMIMSPHRRHWMRHTATVPKGFLRFQVLELLNEKPMSGSEIMTEIAKKTNGCWKPSPGSIYPLLAWMQDNGYVKEQAADESGMKRYALTEKGNELLKAQRSIKEKMQKEARFFSPPFMGPLWFRVPHEKTVEIRESLRRLAVAFFRLGADLEEKCSDKALKEAQRILEEAAQQLEDLDKKLRETKDDR